MENIKQTQITQQYDQSRININQKRNTTGKGGFQPPQGEKRVIVK